VFGLTVAVRVVIPEVPPMVSVAPEPWVNPPEPERAVPTVSELLLVYVPEKVAEGIDNVPDKVWVVPENVCTPVLAVYV